MLCLAKLEILQQGSFISHARNGYGCRLQKLRFYYQAYTWPRQLYSWFAFAISDEAVFHAGPSRQKNADKLSRRLRWIAAGTFPNVTLDKMVDTLVINRVAKNSRSVYSSGFNTFRAFCNLCHVNCCPAAEKRILRFIAHLFKTGYAAATAKVYMAAVFDAHLSRRLSDPTASFHVNKSVAGYKRLSASTPDKRLPITMNLMRRIKNRLLSDLTLSVYDKRLFWASFCLAFFGMMRASEFANSHSLYEYTERTLRQSDVSIHDLTAFIWIRQSKCDHVKNGYTIKARANSAFYMPSTSAF